MKRRKGQYRRVTWHVTRCDAGWKPVVMIGDIPISLIPVETKNEARKLARRRAWELDYESRQH